MDYRLLDHTADIAFEAFGASLDELFENAAKAFYDAFVMVENVRAEEERRIEVSEFEIDYLLYKWLNEILFLFDTEFFAAKNVSVSIKKEKKEYLLEANLLGGKIGPEMIKTEPKAITMHNFTVEKRKEGEREFWYAHVVIDI
ncbi:MAG: archease [Archaeoglobus sp.]|nr:archease [Archaeoglobus sp.]